MNRIVLNKNLYVREGRPSTQAPRSGVLYKDTLVRFKRRVKGDMHKDLDEWFEVSPNKYIWAGGTTMLDSYAPQSWKFVVNNPLVIEKANLLSEKVRDMGLPILWDLHEASSHEQKKVKIALFDTGVDGSNPFLRDQLDDSKCFNARMPSGSEAEGLDKVRDGDGHGTYCAGILAANKMPFIGAAYACDLHIVKIIRGRNFGIKKEVLDRAVDWCIQKEIDVISLSFSMGREIYERKGYEACIMRAREHDIVWVASIGNNPKEIRYPGGSSSCIGVGAIDAKPFLGGNTTPFLPQDFIFAPSLQILPENFMPESIRHNFPNIGGSSFATPIATAFVALIHSISSSKNPDTIKKILKENTVEKIVNSQSNTPYPVIHITKPIAV